ncbi:hypothetical protein FOXB_07838 [Fusarium oxysporum f. sp. conglutinans Fo5176]|uniref:RNase III domain-containing protein n=1 Tax=Fusarium oxysporum (strain Fo5176) TaxID=660025 RepID=F9FN58_FUSOF|nr:hypothetical protein FOXB_07838 [Fusarium oxysporum f. sp. conglutinans Fo5176]
MTSCPRFSRKVSECESIIAYEFNSKSLCAQALNTAASAMSVCVLDSSLKQMPKNNRLAVYGDAAAAAHLCSLWIKRGLPKPDSQDCWTTLRRDLISNDNLARVGRGHGLHKGFNMNGGTTRVPSQLPWNSPVTSACYLRVCLGCLLKKRQKQILCQLGCHCNSLLTLLEQRPRQAPRIMD